MKTTARGDAHQAVLHPFRRAANFRARCYSAAVSSRSNLFARLVQAAPILLDGPTGTALEAGGFRAHPGLWTANVVDRDPALLAAVHDAYLRAGAEIITANTFRTTFFAAQSAGLANPEETAKRWLFSSVALARSCAAKDSPKRFVVGSLAPLADCYRPQETPDDRLLRSEHRRTADWLVQAGCDGILVETQGCGREVRIAVESAVAAAAGTMPVLVSLLPDASGERIFDGEPLSPVAAHCLSAGVSALLVNCAASDVLVRAIEQLRPLTDGKVPLGAYPNAARLQITDGVLRWQADTQAADLGTTGRKLRQAGAQILGACCGFSAGDLSALAAALSESA